VAALLVDALEAVEVEHDDGERRLGLAGALELRAEAFVEAAVVGKAGEAVGGGQLREAVALVAHDRDHPVEAVGELEHLARALELDARVVIALLDVLHRRAELRQRGAGGVVEDRPGPDHEQRDERAGRDHDRAHDRDLHPVGKRRGDPDTAHEREHPEAERRDDLRAHRRTAWALLALCLRGGDPVGGDAGPPTIVAAADRRNAPLGRLDQGQRWALLLFRGHAHARPVPALEGLGIASTTRRRASIASGIGRAQRKA
jgi:hypothetical protein